VFYVPRLALCGYFSLRWSEAAGDPSRPSFQHLICIHSRCPARPPFMELRRIGSPQSSSSRSAASAGRSVVPNFLQMVSSRSLPLGLHLQVNIVLQRVFPNSLHLPIPMVYSQTSESRLGTPEKTMNHPRSWHLMRKRDPSLPELRCGVMPCCGPLYNVACILGILQLAFHAKSSTKDRHNVRTACQDKLHTYIYGGIRRKDLRQAYGGCVYFFRLKVHLSTPPYIPT
jgi:hypothetical protein